MSTNTAATIAARDWKQRSGRTAGSYPETLPLAPEPVAKSLAEHYRLRLQLEAASTAVKTCERQVRTATDADVRDLAGALRAGKKDPGSKAADTARADLEKAKRTRDALTVALTDAEGELQALISIHAGEWVDALNADTSTYKAKVTGILDDLLTDAEQEAQREATRNFVNGHRLKHTYGHTQVVVRPALTQLAELIGVDRPL